MNYGIAVLCAAICAIVAYITLNIDIAKKIKVLGTKEDSEDSKSLSKRSLLAVTVTVLVLTLIACLFLFTTVTDVLTLVRMTVTLVCLTGAACVDYREHRIPNFFPLLIALVAVCCYSIGFILKQDGIFEFALQSVIAAVVVAVFLVISSLISKKGIGAGDIKLLSSIAFIGGVYTVCGTLFFGVLLCALLSVFLLVTKRKGRKSTVPFGPFILVGYIITLCFSIY